MAVAGVSERHRDGCEQAGKSSLTRLLESAQAGDDAAWEMLVRRFDQLVAATASRYGLDQERCQDVAQFTWLRLVEQLGVIRNPEALPGWLRTTAAREALRVARQADRERTVAEVADASRARSTDLGGCLWCVGQRCSEHQDDVAAAIDEIDRGRLLPILQESLDQLTARDRELICSLVLPEEPASYRELSVRLQLPIGSIGPTRARVLIRLRALLESARLTGDVVLA